MKFKITFVIYWLSFIISFNLYPIEILAQHMKLNRNPNVEVSKSAYNYMIKWNIKIYSDKLEFTRETNPRYRFLALPKPGSKKRIVISGLVDPQNPDYCYIYFIGYHKSGDDLQLVFKKGLFRERP